MGLAASQARFLGLTARKSNIEFQGQQINQARTALTNEVMGLYNEYNNVEVPTAPSKYDYVKSTYSIDSTYENYEITNFSKITEGQYEGYYNVNLSYSEEVAKAYTSTVRNAVMSAQKDEEGNYSYLNFTLGTQTYTYDINDPQNSTIVKITDNYEQYTGLTTIMESLGLTDGIFYAYTNNGTTYYTSQNDLDSTAFSPVDDKLMYYGDYTFDYQGVYTTQNEITAIASLTQGSSGRLASINIISCDDDKDLEGKAYSITVGQEDDEAGYADAMNQYNYDKDKYEKELANINAKIEKIQTQDRSLEMKLAQLDTEHDAIAKEMDSVSSVIEDTIDKLFDTSN